MRKRGYPGDWSRRGETSSNWRLSTHEHVVTLSCTETRTSGNIVQTTH